MDGGAADREVTGDSGGAGVLARYPWLATFALGIDGKLERLFPPPAGTAE
jgi:hypothetical protein